jgi:hypothetical protein
MEGQARNVEGEGKGGRGGWSTSDNNIIVLAPLTHKKYVKYSHIPSGFLSISVLSILETWDGENIVVVVLPL